MSNSHVPVLVHWAYVEFELANHPTCPMLKLFLHAEQNGPALTAALWPDGRIRFGTMSRLGEDETVPNNPALPADVWINLIKEAALIARHYWGKS